MTVSVAIEGKGSIAVANTGTETWDKTGLISSPVDETDIYLQGSQAVSTKASGKSGWLYFDIGSGNELDFTPSTGSESGECVFIWLQVTTIGGLDTLANESLAIQIGSSTTDYDRWVIGGSNDMGNGYKGGWLCAVIDPTKSPTSDGGSGLNIASARYFGIYIDNAGSSKSENLIVDQITVGKGLRITGTDTDGWQDVADYCNAYASRAWGQFQQLVPEKVYQLYGMMFVGDSTQTAVTSLADQNRTLVFGDFEYYTGSAWVTALSDGFNGLSVEDAASYTTTFEDGVIVGTNGGRSGSTFIGSTAVDTTFDLYGGNNAASVIKLYGTTFNHIDGGITWGNDSDHHCYNVSFINACGQFDPVGAVKIRNCTFAGYTVDADAALLWNSNIDITDCQFVGITDGTNDPHAIEHASAGTFTYTDLTFSGNDYDINFSAASGTLTINKSGSDPSTYEITGGGTSVTFTGSVTITITPIESGSEVRAYLYDAGPPIANGTEQSGGTESSTGTSHAISIPTSTAVNFVVQKIGKKPVWLVNKSFAVSQSLDPQQRDDPNYRNP